MRLVIVTGMSGAGKSTTLKMLEDARYFCVDNLPLVLLPKFIETLKEPNKEIEQIAIGLDSRSGEKLYLLEQALESMEKDEIEYEILFLESSDDVLVKRYKETRRTHPLSRDGRVDTGIEEERKRLVFLKKKADYIIDTSRMLTRELQAELNNIFVHNKEYANLRITILSFGFKYGIPSDVDLVFDVRFLPNPYYIEELRMLSGNDAPVRDYVMENEKAHEFLWKLEDMVNFLLPNYIAEGKHQLVIGIGCTGGKHRSVTLANELYQYLEKEDRYSVSIEHRDEEKDSKLKGK
ncbi:RNase adapter RapZ [Lachnospiraceae bacterium OttesenSCG-928-E19]|nr:RNase adapter RapZ [Lachnospiraceae bacterium OttesenSCG-928-E19]